MGRRLGGLLSMVFALSAAPARADENPPSEEPSPVGSGVYAHALASVAPSLLRYDYQGPWYPPDGSPPITQEFKDSALGGGVAARFAVGYWLSRYLALAAEVGLDATFTDLVVTDSDFIEGAVGAQLGLHLQVMAMPYLPLFVGAGVKRSGFLASSNDDFDPNRIGVEVHSVIGPCSSLGAGWVSRSGFTALAGFETHVGQERHEEDEALLFTLALALKLGKTWR